MIILSNPSTLHPRNLKRLTHVAADASEHRIQTSIYQEVKTEQKKGVKPKWIPVDHASRTLTTSEQRYSPVKGESLALSWSVEQFRY